ncbi:MAG TPA: YbaK/EbsC family protein [Candidatus Elarobacter sp.]|jgi:prolyl-tRNA editing enzyme YbaK/EbsC (Cys-tRNA(Pro) deacylase)|nr:YbaK/EbsC family protein [Candidatus Elarobacter sp.]
MTIGTLTAVPVAERPDLVASPVREAVAAWPDVAERERIMVAEIDPALADTAAFCERYDVGLDVSANCVVVVARREGRRWFAACVVLATMRADVNGIVKKHLGAAKISFAPMDEATAASGMEYGGITPIGVPADWPVLIDEAVVRADHVIVGSGVRRSKIALPGAVLATLPNATVMKIAYVPG